MANLFLTNTCERECQFCFAKDGPWSEEYQTRPLTLEEVTEFTEMKSLNSSPERGIIGGEPLQYPQLAEVIQILWGKKLIPKIFTSGTCPMPKGLAALKKEGNIRFVVNISEWDSYSSHQQTCLGSFLQTFNKQISLSYTLFDSGADLNFLLDYIDSYKLLPLIRIGIALPVVEKTNVYVPAERYRDVGHQMVDFAQRAARQYVTLGTDCGFVACMFTVEQIGILLRLGMELNFVCHPVIDVGPELEAWHCFPLSQMGRIPLRKYEQLEDVRDDFLEMDFGLRKKYATGIYERCSDCAYRRRGQCSGGCLGMIIPKEENTSYFANVLNENREMENICA